jgi:phospholipid/cholesterol/gamma-HCH transport system ATP-binding protein
MFGPREMLLSSNEPVVRQFLNGQRQGPIGMAEEKDAGELAPRRPAATSSARCRPSRAAAHLRRPMRETQRPPGLWLIEHGVVPRPRGSFEGLDLDIPQGQDGKNRLERHHAAAARAGRGRAKPGRVEARRAASNGS